MIKHFFIKIIRKIIYILLVLVRFPKAKCKNFSKYDNIETKYRNKPIEITDNKFIISDNIDLNIIIPVYNSERFLRKCLESLLNQKTKYKYKIICINDGSTDNSLEILNEFATKYKNIVVLSQENKGIAETRNLGLKNVDSKYISFVDSDDFVNESFIENLLDNAYKNDADIVRCNYYEYDIEKNKIIKKGKNNEKKLYNKGLGKDITKYKGYPWGGVFKTKLWENIQFPNGYWYEDMIIRMILFRRAKKFLYIEDILYYYCVHNNNISKSIEKTENLQCLDQFFLIKNLYKLSKKIDLKEDIDLYINVLYEYSVVLWLRTRKIEKELRKQIFIKACNIINSMENDYKINNEEKLVIKIFKREDYIAWKLYAIYKMLDVKYGSI